MFADSCRDVAIQGSGGKEAPAMDVAYQRMQLHPEFGENVLPLYLSAGIQHDMCEQADAN